MEQGGEPGIAPGMPLGLRLVCNDVQATDVAMAAKGVHGPCAADADAVGRGRGRTSASPTATRSSSRRLAANDVAPVTSEAGEW